MKFKKYKMKQLTEISKTYDKIKRKKHTKKGIKKK